MMRCPLSTLLMAALGTAALTGAMAQGTAKSGAAQTHAPNTAFQTASSPVAETSSDESAVVGTCNGRKITWGQLLAKIKADNPNLISQSAAAYVASEATTTLFGPKPQPSFTITKNGAINGLRLHPNQQISDALELMLTQMAVDDSATRENVQPTQKQVDDKVAALLKSLRDSGRIPKTQSDEAFLVENHTTLAKVKLNYRPQCQLLNLINKELTRQLGHPASGEDMVQASHILVQVKDLLPTATEDEKKKADLEAQTKIKGILAEIRAGKIKFEEAAKSSDDPGSKDKGGDLGIFMRGMMLKEFENAAFSAKPGVVTDPVKSTAGYHIILVTKTGKQITMPEAKVFIDKYEQEKIQETLQRVVEKDNKVENRLKKLVPAPPPQQGFPGGARPPRPQ